LPISLSDFTIQRLSKNMISQGQLQQSCPWISLWEIFDIGEKNDNRAIFSTKAKNPQNYFYHFPGHEGQIRGDSYICYIPNLKSPMG
jgi:hypothetical protein